MCVIYSQHIVYLTYIICLHYHKTTKVAYCVPYLHNTLLLSLIMGAYCVGKVHNILPLQYKDNGSILCRLGAQYATLAVLK